MVRRYKIGLFYSVLASFVFSIVLLLIRDSILMFVLGWEGLGITSFVLIIFYQNWTRFNGGVITLLTNRLGDIVLIAFFVYLIVSLRRTTFLIARLLIFRITKR